MENRWMTSDEVAEYLGISMATLYRLMRNGKITYYKTNEFKKYYFILQLLCCIL